MEFVALKERKSESSFQNFKFVHNPVGTSDKIKCKVRKKCGEIFIDENDLFNFLCTLCEASFEEINNFFVHVKGVHSNGNTCIRIKQEDPLGPSDDDDDSRVVKHEPNVQITTIDDAEIKLPEYSEETVDSLNAYSNANSEEDVKKRVPYNTRRRTLLNKSSQESKCQQNENEDKNDSNKKDSAFDMDKNEVTIKEEKVAKRCKTEPICEICGKSFSTTRNLRKHRKKVNCSLSKLSKPFVCETCGTTFSSKKSLGRHHRNAICDHRQKIADTKTISDNVLIENIEDDTKIEKPEPVSNKNATDPKKCRYCDRLFAASRRRIEHERIHTGEKPYQCRFCGKLFRVHSHVCVHEKTHTVVQEFICDICNKTCKNKLCLQAHKIRHGEKKFPCGYCDMSFFNSRELKDHVRTHTGEKRYKCNLCEKSFVSSGSFNYHKKKHTGWIHIVKE